MTRRQAPAKYRFPLWLLLLGLLLSAARRLPAQVRAIELHEHGDSANSIRSSAVDAGDYVYISGQGGQRPDGSTPGKFEDQASQALENIKTVVVAAGLSLKHIVYV